jgi:hypothetical protein
MARRVQRLGSASIASNVAGQRVERMHAGADRSPFAVRARRAACTPSERMSAALHMVHPRSAWRRPEGRVSGLCASYTFARRSDTGEIL